MKSNFALGPIRRMHETLSTPTLLNRMLHNYVNDKAVIKLNLFFYRIIINMNYL